MHFTDCVTLGRLLESVCASVSPTVCRDSNSHLIWPWGINELFSKHLYTTVSHTQKELVFVKEIKLIQHTI